MNKIIPKIYTIIFNLFVIATILLKARIWFRVRFDFKI